MFAYFESVLVCYIFLLFFTSVLNSQNFLESKKFPNKLPEVQTKKKTPRMFDSNNILPREPIIQRPRSNPITETPYADQAIKRWKEKMMNQSQGKLICVLN